MMNNWINPFFEQSPPEPILRDVFTGWKIGGGIFSYLSDVTTMPWEAFDYVSITSLDIAYFGNHSGGKFCSPLVKFMIDEETGDVPPDNRISIATLLITKYLKNWEKLFDTMLEEYSPIHNYDMTEIRSTLVGDSEAETIVSNEESSMNTENTSREDDYKYGMNSMKNNPPNSDRIDSISSSSSSNSSDSSNNRNRVGAKEESENIHRSGNIGVTTTQRLIEEERNVWFWVFFDKVFSDLDSELALMFHDACRV